MSCKWHAKLKVFYILHVALQERIPTFCQGVLTPATSWNIWNVHIFKKKIGKRGVEFHSREHHSSPIWIRQLQCTEKQRLHLQMFVGYQFNQVKFTKIKCVCNWMNCLPIFSFRLRDCFYIMYMVNTDNKLTTSKMRFMQVGVKLLMLLNSKLVYGAHDAITKCMHGTFYTTVH